MHRSIGETRDFLIFRVERGDRQRAQRGDTVQSALRDRNELLINQAFFFGIIATDDPVDEAAFRRCKPHFLGEFFRTCGLVEIDLIREKAQGCAEIEGQVVAELLL